MPSGFTFSETQHLAVGAMTTVRRWADDDYLKLGIDLKVNKGLEVDLDVRLGAAEARRLAAHLVAAADALEADRP